ncbi:type III secretion system export apparatus subunit SctT [Paraburkholderia kururiensis]|jgi:type III secretion protein T|uniref:type III secretion system export apparatus subunit SctT n=1 Tax=Paraburkholderia kururiensis TaxID=984307 RepID=UPI000344AB91|nr:type III secretion system export apparatus subunit SctT [Paraburkholderia kururiensis]
MNDLFNALPQLGTTFVGYMTLLGICSVRLLVIMSMFPPTADGVLQGVVRNGVAMLLSTFVAYGQPASLMTTLSGVHLIELGLREAVIGLVLGYAASTVFWVAESAGTYVDDLTGYNNMQVTNPLREEQSTPTGALLSQVAIVAFWTLGGMTFLLGVVYESYHWWPLTSNTPVAANIFESFVLRQTDTLMQTTAKLAAPMLFILLMIDFAFGFVSKSAQKLDLMTLSQPVKGAMTVLMLALLVGIFVDQVKDQLVLTSLGEQLRAIATAQQHH